jgi:hypothetical protein
MSRATATTPGGRFRGALADERPLQVPGAINAYHAILAQKSGFRAIYLSGGGVAAGSLGLPDLGISNLDDVLTDVRRITDVCELPLLVDVDTGFGASAFNIARTVKSLIKFGAAAMHIEDQVGAKRCGHRPGKAIVGRDEMVDRVKAAVDARTDADFVVMARTDALAVEGLDAAFHARRAAIGRRRDRALPAVGVPRDEPGRARRVPDVAPRRDAEGGARHDADARRPLRVPRLPRLREQARRAVRAAERGDVVIVLRPSARRGRDRDAHARPAHDEPSRRRETQRRSA